MIDQRVTVFGASGFLGRYAVRGLAKGGLGYRIRAAVRSPNGAPYLLPMGHVGQIQLLRANVLRPADVARAVADSEAVVNLVGILNPAGGGQSFHAIHVEAARTIGRAAREAGVQSLVHISTPGISRDSESVYARSKAEGEVALRQEFPDATILRPSLVAGPEDNFFNKFANLARFVPVLPLVGGGHTRFQPVFVGDVADAIVKCIENPATRGQTYELGGPSILSLREMLQLILHVTNRRRLLVPPPFALARIPAFALQFLPGKLLTPDQVTFLKTDNIVAPDALTFADLGIEPESLESVLPSYLWRFRKKGQFENSAYERAIGTPATR
ncbi:MAG TPA: complex I NDUFA9 subunit family protein [Rhizomicrobium sp.]|jgi:NADH dehydrogenase|nr:complex I NDUFA9 subunit family protein [Rhizomicrobium sp.]